MKKNNQVGSIASRVIRQTRRAARENGVVGPRRSLTAFERQVLKAVLRIPFGETRSYRWVAEQVGRPLAVRAVGQALRKNPYPLLIPCHRVIKSDGSAGAYAGKDDGTKQCLIRLEQELREGFFYNKSSKKRSRS